MKADSSDIPHSASTTSDVQMEPWMCDEAKYSRFWQHYQEMQRWMNDYVSSWKQNFPAQSESSGADSNQYLNRSPHGYEPYAYHLPHYNTHPQVPPTGHSRKNTRARHGKCAKNSKQRLHPQRNVQGNDVAMEVSTDNEDYFEYEVSDEMKAFFAMSEEFRRKRDNAKEKGQLYKPVEKSGGDAKSRTKEDAQNETDEIELSSSESDRQDPRSETSTPKERPGLRRIVEMKELYGRHAAAIHGMETAMQLQFDRNYDRKKPAFWPIVPLKM